MGASPYHIEVVLLWLLCITTLNSVTTCSSKVGCNKKDMNMLLNLKHGVTDLSSSWLPENDCCLWEGVQCDNITGRVTKLSLPCHPIPSAYSDTEDKSHCLTGELDLSSLLHLEFLNYLDLSNNDFKGFIYNYSLANTSNLQHLDLSYNDDLLIDNLSWISRFSSLQYLDLSGIDLHKETDWLRSVTILPSLLTLHLKGCQLHNIYPSLQFANFTSLVELDLGGNDFISKLPGWIFNFSSDISLIDLSKNYLHGQLPQTLSNLRSLSFLEFSGNNLDGPIPHWLGQLEHLQVLDLSLNLFFGLIPTSLGNLSSLVELSLNSNNLDGNLPENLGKILSLEFLDVGDNFLIGNISERNFYSLSNLKDLSLSSPALIFDFDPEWIPPFQLQILMLGYVGPKLPSWLYTQNSLILLSIVHSRSSFEPLDKFWKFAAQLEDLVLWNNSINADISNVLLNSKTVWLPENNLRGSVPRVSPNVTILNLVGNSLSGSISPILCYDMKEKGNLEVLALSYNILSGEIPNCWLGHSMKGLLLRSNQFSGNIPTKICQLHSLRILDIAYNRLSGPIPNCLHNMTSMTSEDASIDEFFIRIIVANQSITYRFNLTLLVKGIELPYSNSMYVIDLSSNNLSGTMPSELFLLTRLQSLNLSHNQLVGMMPAEIDNLKQLESLDLSSNRLSGQIPESMSSMSFLGDLNLSFNNLTGRIPSGTQLQGFTNLSYTGNPKLCGLPLTKICTQDEKSHNTNLTTEDDGEESEVHSWFYMGLGIGFATGFCGVLGVIFLNRRCRHAYFKF